MNYNYNYGSTNELIALILGILSALILFFIIVYVITVIGQWKVLKKSGKPGWGALIPIYNTYQFCSISGVSPWWILISIVGAPILSVIPVIGSILSLAVSIYFSILLNVSIARSFNKSDGFAVGLILLPIVFYLILGFSNDKYVGPKPMRDILFDNINKTTQCGNLDEQIKYCSKCGTQLSINDQFCKNCGNKV